MKPKPLKNKSIITVDKNINIVWENNQKPDILFSRVMIYQHDDVKAAVAWLKGQIHDRQKDKPGFDPFLAFVKEKIDEAFQDVTK